MDIREKVVIKTALKYGAKVGASDGYISTKLLACRKAMLAAYKVLDDPQKAMPLLNNASDALDWIHMSPYQAPWVLEIRQRITMTKGFVRSGSIQHAQSTVKLTLLAISQFARKLMGKNPFMG